MAKLNSSIFANRTSIVNHPPRHDGKSVLYVMARDQRVIDNFGLLVAQEYALQHKLPLAVVFCFIPSRGERAREQFNFMLAGLQQIELQLAKLNIPLIALFGKHNEVITNLASHCHPSLIVTDFSPLKGVRKWQHTLAKTEPLIIVDSHNIVPVWQASSKQEFSARTLRPKIHNQLATCLADYGMLSAHPYAWPGTVLPLTKLQDRLDATRTSYPINSTQLSMNPGENAGQVALREFLDTKLNGYADQRNDPTLDGQSNLSPYIHFGMLASITAVRAVMERVAKQPSLQRDADAFIEEIVVRKELSDNFCLYSKDYTTLAAAPEWAKATLQKHTKDPREYIYSEKQFEDAQTHDPAWNAAQNELRKTGKMHGYMRMYWAKKVLEWSATPKEALQTLIYLNDFYSIDGGDPNGYVGILWSVAGVHDRPWGERPIYGTVRSMVYNGLKRKFSITEYERKWV